MKSPSRRDRIRIGARLKAMSYAQLLSLFPGQRPELPPTKRDLLPLIAKALGARLSKGAA